MGIDCGASPGRSRAHSSQPSSRPGIYVIGLAVPVLAATPGLPAVLRLAAVRLGAAPALAFRGMVGEFQRHDAAAPVAALTRLGERFKQAAADPLAGHLHQAERGDLGDLVLGPVPRQAFQQPPQHQVPVALQDHVDEVDHDDPADVAQPELADHLLGRLQVVAGDRLLQVSALAGELPGVDVHHGHGLGIVDHQ